MRALPNRMPTDDSIIADLLVAVKGGAKHTQQHGTLMAFIVQCQTTYTRLHGLQGMSSTLNCIDHRTYKAAYMSRIN
jgi:hypothetical protein